MNRTAMGITVTAGFLAALAADPGLAADPREIDWQKIPAKSVLLFYPGESTAEWLVSSAHKGARSVKQGKRCVSCHEADEKDLGGILVKGGVAEPTPIQVAMYNAARARLKILADRTGGTLNAINRLEEMGRLYASVAAELRTLYTIEYQSTNEKRDGKWRAIKIEVNNAELISKTRQGYFAR